MRPHTYYNMWTFRGNWIYDIISVDIWSLGYYFITDFLFIDLRFTTQSSSVDMVAALAARKAPKFYPRDKNFSGGSGGRFLEGCFGYWWFQAK